MKSNVVTEFSEALLILCNSNIMGKNCLEKVMSKCRIKGAPFFNELMMFKGQSLKMVCFGERKDQSVHINTGEKGRRQCSRL